MASARGGFAAALALCLLAVAGGIASASFYLVVEARRAANRSARQDEAAAAADAALYAALDGWAVRVRDSMPIGSTDSATAFVTRLTNRVYWVTAAREVAAGTSVGALRLHNLLVEIRRPGVPVRAAITSAGAVLAGPGAVISGADSHPPEWTDCPPADTAAAPPILADEDSATYEVLGPVATAALAARADVTLAAGAIVSPSPDLARRCAPIGSHMEPQSWGEPGRTGQTPDCERFLPVVHGLGDLHVTSGRGQGILLVNGRLRIDGPFVYHGVVLARGGIETRGSDVIVYGAVLSADPRGVIWNASGQVRHSGCAVARASEAAVRPYPVPHRAWAELF